MEHQKILNFLSKANNSKFVTRKWNIVNDKSNAYYDEGNESINNTEVLKSYLCDYSDIYILVRGDIITAAHNNKTPVAFKNCAPFTKWLTKIDGATKEDAEDLDLVMLMYNLIEYSSSYSDTTYSLWFHSKDEATNFNADIANTKTFKLLEITVADGNGSILRNATIAVPLKYLSNFWRILEMLLINCKVVLQLR